MRFTILPALWYESDLVLMQCMLLSTKPVCSRLPQMHAAFNQNGMLLLHHAELVLDLKQSWWVCDF